MRLIRSTARSLLSETGIGYAAPEGSALRAQDDRRFRAMALAIAGTAVTLLVWYLFEYGWPSIAGLFVAAAAVFFSKITIFGGAAEQVAFSPWGLGLIAWVLDLIASVALLAGVKGLDRMPVLGPVVVQSRTRASEALARFPGLRRLAIWGIFLFVFVPLPGSGAVVGTLISQIIGLSRVTALLTVGSGAGCSVVVYAWIADRVGEHGRDLLESPEVLAAIAGGSLLAGWLAWRYVKRVLSRA